jgi:hypothetical protein
MSTPLHAEVLRRLEAIGKPASASVISRAGEQLELAAVWDALGDLWVEEKVDGYPDGPWRMHAAARARQMTLGEGA